MGGFSIDHYTDVDVDMFDIIDNISKFDNDELLKLKEEVDQRLNRNSITKSNIIEASTLEEEYKIEILKEFFNKYSWSELEEIKKKLM